MIVGVRHAAVRNPDGVVYARLPEFHLSEEGASEARGFGAALASTPVAAVYASPLVRAVETAEALAEPHGLEVRIDERLVEWAFWTRWEGLRWDRIRDRDPDLLERYAADPGSVSVDGGDSLALTGGRVLAWAEDADRVHPGELVLGVTHESPLAAAYLLGSGRDLDGFHGVRLGHLATVRLLPWPAERVDLVAWATTC
jgi:2,3-bisphosphoglycerate-dependent phosphoglycerate mutase